MKDKVVASDVSVVGFSVNGVAFSAATFARNTNIVQKIKNNKFFTFLHKNVD